MRELLSRTDGCVALWLRGGEVGDVVDDSDGDLAGAVADCEVVGGEAGEVEGGVAGDVFGDDELGGVVFGGLFEARGDVDRVAHRREIEALAPAHPTDNRGAGVDADADPERCR